MGESEKEHESTPQRQLDRFAPLAPWALATAVVLLYAPTLGADWLEYDDDWLVRDNPFLNRPTLEHLATIWTAFDRGTRLALGAEYLPIRDTSEWIEARLVGVSPFAARLVSLAIYVAGCLLIRRWLLELVSGERAVAETASWVFALHPVHAESVAWIAGRKDVLALALTAGALVAYASDRAWVRRAAVPLCVALACLSKAVSVVVPLLLPLHDFLKRRRADPIALGGAAVASAFTLAIHLHVGSTVSMIATLPGGSRAAALATMGPVFVRYVGVAFGVLQGSIVYDVPDRAPGDPVAVVSWLFLALLAGLGVALALRGNRLPLFAMAVFAISLAPVSQIVAPLQNRMADRYLLVAVLGPVLVLAAGVVRVARWVGRSEAVFALAAAVVLPFGVLGALRVRTFADPEVLWTEAIERAPRSPVGPYQRAMHRRQRGDLIGAEADFREALARDGMRTEKGRRAANNLAILLASTGREEEAIALLERAVERYPDDPRVRHNLARLLARRGDMARAAELDAEVARRFPTYRARSVAGPPSLGSDLRPEAQPISP
jgi:hypothetical protein